MYDSDSYKLTPGGPIVDKSSEETDSNVTKAPAKATTQRRSSLNKDFKPKAATPSFSHGKAKTAAGAKSPAQVDSNFAS